MKIPCADNLSVSTVSIAMVSLGVGARPKCPSSLGCLIRSISALMSCHPEPIFSLEVVTKPCVVLGDVLKIMHWSWSKSRHKRFLSFDHMFCFWPKTFMSNCSPPRSSSATFRRLVAISKKNEFGSSSKPTHMSLISLVSSPFFWPLVSFDFLSPGIPRPGRPVEQGGFAGSFQAQDQKLWKLAVTTDDSTREAGTPQTPTELSIVKWTWVVNRLRNN